MKKLDSSRYRVHINICTNERFPPASCCKSVGGQEFYEALKKRVKASPMSATHKVTRTGCLGGCNIVGCTVLIHSEGKTVRAYNEMTLADLDFIWMEITKE